MPDRVPIDREFLNEMRSLLDRLELQVNRLERIADSPPPENKGETANDGAD